jgi:hydrogenase maturation protease
MSKALILGFGNIDRQDDGVAWHVLYRLAERLDYPLPPPGEDDLDMHGEPADLLYTLQLTPEIASDLAQYDRVCFVDAHTGNLPSDLDIHPIHSQFQTSPLTHHMTPETTLSFAGSLYGHTPKAILVSVRGYEFGFERSLTPKTSHLADQAVDAIFEWLKEIHGSQTS